MNEIEEKYFVWMTSKIFEDSDLFNSYEGLLNELNVITFHSEITMDENRVTDAQDMRYIFGAEVGYAEGEICRMLDYKPPSVLEIIVALICRVQESVLDNLSTKLSNQAIFMDILKSLNLDWIKGQMTGEKINYVLDSMFTLFSREYTYYGEGGLFTVNSPKNDMRETDIWYQFMWYLDEKLGGKYL